MKHFFTSLFLFFSLLKITSAQSILLDPTFGKAGIVKTDLGSPYNYADNSKQVLVQPDGTMFFILTVNGTSLISKRHPDGSADSTYGTNGLSEAVAIQFGKAAIDTSGRLIIGGNAIPAQVQSYNPLNFAVARFNTNGSLDKTFNGGIQTIDLNQEDIVHTVAIQNDGKIIVAGRSGSPVDDQCYFSITRYNDNGTIDSIFNKNGAVVIQVEPYFQEANTVAIQNDGKIVIAGDAEPQMFGANESAILRFNSDGSIDSSFNGTGSELVDFGVSSTFNSVIIQPDGKIVAGGTDFARFLLARFNNNGGLDSTFNNTGMQITDFGNPVQSFQTSQTLTSIYVLPGGGLAALGHLNQGTNSYIQVAHYTTDGMLDNSFNGTGKQSIEFGTNDIVNDVTLQNDEQLVATGYTTDSHVAAARYNLDGTPDISFNGTGMLTDYILQGTSNYTCTALQSDGKIVAAGYAVDSTNNYAFAIARYNTDGSLDNTFNGTGKAHIRFTSLNDIAYALAIQADGKIVVTGNAGNDFGVARFNTDGTLDNTFDGDGMLTTSFGFTVVPVSVFILPNGKILAGGTSIARYNTNGTLDSTFNGNGKLLFPNGSGGNFTLQNNGKIVFYGGPSIYYAVYRFNPDGSPDNSFGSNGETDIFSPGSGGEPYIYLRAIQSGSDNKIVFAGSLIFDERNNTSKVLVVKLDSSGNFDNSFGTNGVVYGTVDDYDLAHGTSLVIQPDNKIIVGGDTYNGANTNFLLARYNLDGTLDNTFNNNGLLFTNASSANNSISGLILNGSNLYAAGYGQYPGNFAVVAKYLLSAGGALPVSFMNFTATLKDKSVVLNWKTASEHNLSLFTIERSRNATSFSPIGIVAAVGNSSLGHSYSTIDPSPLSGTNFYRLKLVNTDGQFTYSNVVAVNFGNKSFDLHLFPNPAVNTLFVQAYGNNEKSILRILDATGRSVAQATVTLNGLTSFSVDVSALPTGIYHLQMQTSLKTETSSFIKNR